MNISGLGNVLFKIEAPGACDWFQSGLFFEAGCVLWTVGSWLRMLRVVSKKNVSSFTALHKTRSKSSQRISEPGAVATGLLPESQSSGIGP